MCIIIHRVRACAAHVHGVNKILTTSASAWSDRADILPKHLSSLGISRLPDASREAYLESEFDNALDLATFLHRIGRKPRMQQALNVELIQIPDNGTFMSAP